MVRSESMFTGNLELFFRWTPFTDHIYESFWTSSVRPNLNSSVAGSVIGKLGVPDGVISDGSSAPNVTFQRPALY